MVHDGLVLTHIDIKNAFNSIPHEAIFNELRRQKVSSLYMNYVHKFLENRHCEFRNKITCGVAQGDSNSSLLFCIAINPIVEKLAAKYNILVYADDILIGHLPS